MTRIAYVLTQDSGGPVDVTIRLAHTLVGLGHDVRVFGPPPLRDAHLIDGRHEPVVFGNKGNVRQARDLRARIRAWHPEVVHAQDRRAGLAMVGLGAGARGVGAVVHTYHGVPDDVGEPWFRVVADADGPSRYTRAVLTGDAVVARIVDQTVVPSTAMAEFLTRRLHVPPRKLTHIDNGVLLPPCMPPTGPVRRLIFVGLLVERKAVLNLLAALSVPDVMPADASLTIAGDGPQRRVAESAVAAGPLAGRVEFLGFRSDVADLLEHHDALVLPSLMEQQPLVIAEAMGAGKPVVATDTGGVAEMLTVDGTEAFLAPPGDVAALAAQLRRLFAEPRPDRIGATMGEYARRRFDAQVSAQAHLRLYERLSAR